jgi:hypothetical protein
MIPLLMPFPTTIEPRKAVFEVKYRIDKGGSATKPKPNTVPYANGKPRIGSARAER